MAAQRALLRLLLLTAVAIGVAGMHTLGHPSSDHSSMKATPSAAASHGMTAASHHQAAADILAMPVAVTVALAPATGGGMGMDPMTVCMAIMTAFGLLLLAAMMMFARRRSGGDRHAEPKWAAAASRGPPRSARIGLRLADLSVLRT